MIVSVIGFGHVGSVVGSVLADRGCKVYGIDKNIDLITSFKKGLSPINEPGLQKLITNGLEKSCCQVIALELARGCDFGNSAKKSSSNRALNSKPSLKSGSKQMPISKIPS